MPGMFKVDFAFGAPGLEWDANGTVTKAPVGLQAAAYGVKPNWSIVLINGVEVTNAGEIQQQFNMCRKLGKKYPVTFMKDAAAIRVDQAAREAKEAEEAKLAAQSKAEADRKAKARADAEAKAQAETDAKKDAYWEGQKQGAAGEGTAYDGPDTSAQVGASGTLEDQYMRANKDDQEEIKAYKNGAGAAADIPEQIMGA